MKRSACRLLAFFIVLSGIAVAQQPINLTYADGTALGAPSNYGTSPGAVAVLGVNAYITNVPTVAQATAANLNATVVGTGTFVTQSETEDGAGNSITSNSTTYTSKHGLDSNLLGVLGTAFTTAGFVDVKGADGNVFVRQATAANLNATVVGSGVFEVGPTTGANTKTNAFFTNITDGTNDLTAALSAWGTAPTGTYVMGVNANILGPIDGSGYVEINCKTGCGAGGTMSLVPETTGGLSNKHFVAAASDNATNLKSSAGQVYSVDIYNAAAYPVYLKLYNASSSPTGCAATNLFKVIGVQAGTQKTLASEEGYALGTGIGYCLTKGITDADDTAVLLSDASADIGWK